MVTKAKPAPVKEPPAVKLTGRGGAGRGQGRKPAVRASAKKKSYADAARIGAGEILGGGWAPEEDKFPALPTNATPLDVMVEAMRRAYKLGGPIAAFPYAEKAAPYLHAKISSIELKTPSPTGSSNAGSKFLVEFVKPAQVAEGDDDAA